MSRVLDTACRDQDTRGPARVEAGIRRIEHEEETGTGRSFGKGPLGEGGFGLVEAIVAIVVFGIGTVAVAGLTLTAGTHANRAAAIPPDTFHARIHRSGSYPTSP